MPVTSIGSGTVEPEPEPPPDPPPRAAHAARASPPRRDRRRRAAAATGGIATRRQSRTTLSAHARRTTLRRTAGSDAPSTPVVSPPRVGWRRFRDVRGRASRPARRRVGGFANASSAPPSFRGGAPRRLSRRLTLRLEHLEVVFARPRAGPLFSLASFAFHRALLSRMPAALPPATFGGVPADAAAARRPAPARPRPDAPGGGVASPRAMAGRRRAPPFEPRAPPRSLRDHLYCCRRDPRRGDGSGGADPAVAADGVGTPPTSAKAPASSPERRRAPQGARVVVFGDAVGEFFHGGLSTSRVLLGARRLRERRLRPTRGRRGSATFRAGVPSRRRASSPSSCAACEAMAERSSERASMWAISTSRVVARAARGETRPRPRRRRRMPPAAAADGGAGGGGACGARCDGGERRRARRVRRRPARPSREL